MWRCRLKEWSRLRDKTGMVHVIAGLVVVPSKPSFKESINLVGDLDLQDVYSSEAGGVNTWELFGPYFQQFNAIRCPRGPPLTLIRLKAFPIHVSDLKLDSNTLPENQSEETTSQTSDLVKRQGKEVHGDCRFDDRLESKECYSFRSRTS